MHSAPKVKDLKDAETNLELIDPFEYPMISSHSVGRTLQSKTIHHRFWSTVQNTKQNSFTVNVEDHRLNKPAHEIMVLIT